MAVAISDVFNATMAIMDELSNTGQAQTTDTKEYEYRTPSIINMMVSELKMLTGDFEDWLAVESMDDLVPEANTSYALGCMPYGLAANLLVDENPTAASFYQQRYEELRNVYVSRQSASVDDITNFYGGIGYGEFARW